MCLFASLLTSFSIILNFERFFALFRLIIFLFAFIAFYIFITFTVFVLFQLCLSFSGFVADFYPFLVCSSHFWLLNLVNVSCILFQIVFFFLIFLVILKITSLFYLTIYNFKPSSLIFEECFCLNLALICLFASLLSYFGL